MWKKIFPCLVSSLLLLLSASRALALPTEFLLPAADPANRIDIAILGDGYRTEDQAQLTADANNVLKALFAEGAYGEYREYFNARLVHVISNQTGADNGSAGGLRDTALGAFFNCSGVDRLLCVDNATVLSVAAANVPEFDVVLVVVNDAKYGGAGGSQILTTSISVSPPAFEVPVHEMGHTLIGLADEYDSPFPGFPECNSVSDCVEPNVTLFTDRATLKWSQWVDASTPLPTPDTPPFSATVGAFEGARYLTTGVFRPVSQCLMRTLGRSLCPVCSEAGVLETYSRVTPIDRALPAGPVTLDTGESVAFTIQGPRPEPNTLSFSWSLDGSALAVNATGVLTLSGADFGPGAHTLSVEIHDQTTRVRRDPSSLLISTFAWLVTGPNARVDPCVLGTTSVALHDRVILDSNLHAGSFVFDHDVSLSGSVLSLGNGDLGDRSLIASNATLGGTLSGNRAGVLGTLREGASVSLPQLAMRTFTVGSGTQSFGTTTLSPATRGNVRFLANSAITLNAGTYRFASLTVELGVRINVRPGGVDLNVQGPLTLGDRVRVLAGSPSGLLLYTNAANLRIGTDVLLTGVVAAPAAAISVASRSHLTGCVGGRSLSFDTDVDLDSGGTVLPTR